MLVELSMNSSQKLGVGGYTERSVQWNKFL